MVDPTRNSCITEWKRYLMTQKRSASYSLQSWKSVKMVVSGRGSKVSARLPKKHTTTTLRPTLTELMEIKGSPKAWITLYLNVRNHDQENGRNASEIAPALILGKRILGAE